LIKIIILRSRAQIPKEKANPISVSLPTHNPEPLIKSPLKMTFAEVATPSSEIRISINQGSGTGFGIQ
jgi:hypothetical protein